jgi:hypothetical protein
MKSIANQNDKTTSLPLVADDVLEFHASRILLLILVCGKGEVIDGLTKMAKLDFFVRYPKFFMIACKELKKDIVPTLTEDAIESNMVRYHYGPWDQRYYHILSYLESRALIDIAKHGKTYNISLTEQGKEVCIYLSEHPAFYAIISHMKQVGAVLSDKRGSFIKELIYKVFDKEVAQKTLGEVID